VSVAELRRFNPEVWLVLPSSGTKLGQIRAREDMKGIAAVRAGRLIPVREEDFAPGMDLPERLGRMIDILDRARR
jgi:ABC-type Fe3+-hydroxamate transport system substrate-binding protein